MMTKPPKRRSASLPRRLHPDAAPQTLAFRLRGFAGNRSYLEIARSSGISISTVSRLFSGQGGVRGALWTTLCRIADTLEIKVDALMSRPAPRRLKIRGSFADRLKALRVAARLTQRDLSELAGLYMVPGAANTVNKLERGHGAVTWNVVCLLAEALGAGVGELRPDA
ncbi:MAG: helix-turn-helix transcriptional regulator [Patescibacteria group bacterium]|nr:helix-turn-helix transcriptional regulator [Patescibacteria group bacterium]